MIQAVHEIEFDETADTEAYQTLMARVAKRTGKIPGELVVRHVMEIVPAGEWPVRVDATDALLRRIDAIERDGLRIDARPGNGRVLGLYRTRRRGDSARPYATLVNAVDPFDARCDCPDFLRNSLGLCKHALIILEHLHAHPRLLRQALREQEDDAIRLRDRPVRRLGWDPIRPLSGPGDWLERVFWENGSRPNSDGHTERLDRWFQKSDDIDGLHVLKQTFADCAGRSTGTRQRPAQDGAGPRGIDLGRPRPAGAPAGRARSAPASRQKRDDSR